MTAPKIEPKFFSIGEFKTVDEAELCFKFINSWRIVADHKGFVDPAFVFEYLGYGNKIEVFIAIVLPIYCKTYSTTINSLRDAIEAWKNGYESCQAVIQKKIDDDLILKKEAELLKLQKALRRAHKDVFSVLTSLNAENDSREEKRWLTLDNIKNRRPSLRCIPFDTFVEIGQSLQDQGLCTMDIDWSRNDISFWVN